MQYQLERDSGGLPDKLIVYHPYLLEPNKAGVYEMLPAERDEIRNIMLTLNVQPSFKYGETTITVSETAIIVRVE